MKKPKHLILDRDGVINYDSDNYIRSPEEWHPIPGALEAIAALTKAGFKISIATNQSGIARQYFSPLVLDAIHDKMRQAVQQAGGKIHQIAFCPHGPNDGCDCRKPKPGLLYQLQAKGVELQDTPFVGDSLRDIQAAQSAGCRPILVLTGKGQKTLKQNSFENISIFEDLAQVSKALLAQ